MQGMQGQPSSGEEDIPHGVVLNMAILALPTSCRTRTNNLALTASITGSLPEYYRLFKEDICVL